MSHVFIPGSFDPLHLGHLDVILAAHQLFGQVSVGVLYNREKSAGLFSPEERVDLIGAALAEQPDLTADAVRVFASDQLAVDAAADVGADFIVKGLRTAADYEIEQQMAHTNQAVSGLRTVFVPCKPEHSYISSRFIREIAARNGDITVMVSTPIAEALSARFSKE